MDIMRRIGAHVRITLPGASLFYGNCSALAKGVTLLWASWLLAGPGFDDMMYFLSKVTSITTDFGAEIRTLELPMILQAFLAWNSGTDLLSTAPLVVHSQRLFYNALRIGGW